jgi:ABC-type antimicrobial peptide transport system ATPase subunit
MEEGEVVEYGTPWELLAKQEEGAFARLVARTGAETAQFLRAEAHKAHLSRATLS